MAVITAVANQKGGVAKTTTVAALGAALVRLGRRVLLVDLDPQASLSFALGVDPDAVLASSYDVLLGCPLADAVVGTTEGMDLVPATIDLAGAEAALLDRSDRIRVLRQALVPARDAFEDILLDCSPTLGVLTLNALAAADRVVIPMAAEMLSHRAVGQLIDTVADVRATVNPDLTVAGLLPTMVDSRTAHARDVLADVTERYELPVLAAIPRSVRVAEAPMRGQSIVATSRGSKAARAYLSVARQLSQAES